MPKQVRVERTIRGEADELYDLVSDLPRMGEWSPENTGGRWVNGAAGPVVGARFKGSNKKGLAKWSTDVVVTVAEPGERFSFDVTRGPMKISNWDYRFEQQGGITSVVETWTDHRAARDRHDRRLADRGRATVPITTGETMEATLANLAAAVEV